MSVPITASDLITELLRTATSKIDKLNVWACIFAVVALFTVVGCSIIDQKLDDLISQYKAQNERETVTSTRIAAISTRIVEIDAKLREFNNRQRVLKDGSAQKPRKLIDRDH